MNAPQPDRPRPVLWWAWRLLRVTVMIVAAYWLSRTGDAFFYQGF